MARRPFKLILDEEANERTNDDDLNLIKMRTNRKKKLDVVQSYPELKIKEKWDEQKHCQIKKTKIKSTYWIGSSWSCQYTVLSLCSFMSWDGTFLIISYWNLKANVKQIYPFFLFRRNFINKVDRCLARYSPRAEANNGTMQYQHLQIWYIRFIHSVNPINSKI